MDKLFAINFTLHYEVIQNANIANFVYYGETRMEGSTVT